MTTETKPFMLTRRNLIQGLGLVGFGAVLPVGWTVFNKGDGWYDITMELDNGHLDLTEFNDGEGLYFCSPGQEPINKVFTYGGVVEGNVFKCWARLT